MKVMEGFDFINMWVWNDCVKCHFKFIVLQKFLFEKKFKFHIIMCYEIYII